MKPALRRYAKLYRTCPLNKAKQAARLKAYRRANPEKRMFWVAKTRAAKRNIPFTISIDDIIIPDVCPVLGIPLFLGDGRLGPNSPSLDRVVPVLGYVPGNICVISNRANVIKNDGTAEEHEAIAAWMRACKV